MANEGTNTLSVLSSKTNTVVAIIDTRGVIGTGSGAVGVAFYPATGTIYVTLRGSNTVQSVGGIVLPIDKLALVLPYIALAVLLTTATALTAKYLNRVKNRGERRVAERLARTITC